MVTVMQKCGHEVRKAGMIRACCTELAAQLNEKWSPEADAQMQHAIPITGPWRRMHGG
jgi:hypothetical protein